MNRALLAIGGLLVGLLALLFAAPAMVDWNRYRGVFEEEASRFLGREVRVGGRVNLRLLPVPYVRFEDVRVADTTASIGKPLFMAEDFTVWLSVGSLIKGTLEASEIELRRPVVTLVLDGQGGGSWSSLAPGSWQGSFTPSQVALNAVRITDGTLAILASDGRPKTTFAHINGELSAQALEGPYKITAAFAHGDRPREIRLATAKVDNEGAVRFKGTVRDPASGINYSLDGSARDVVKRLAVTGELTARLPLPAAMLAGTPSPKAASSNFDLKAQLKGDTRGFTLSDLALSFEQGGRPQLASGSARVAWLEQTDVSVNLASHWLDIDRIAGLGTGRPPLELADTMLTAISSALGTEGRTDATLNIEQATLGGDVVSDLSASLEQSHGKFSLKNLSAHLPGGAQIATSGSFEPKAEGSGYDGRINLRGASLTRFLGWAARDWPLALPTRDAAFALTGDLALGKTTLAARNVALQIGRNSLTGEAGWSRGAQSAITLKLDGSEIDLSSVTDKQAGPGEALKSLITRFTGPGASGTAEKSANADIKLRVDRLIAGSLTLRDVDTEMQIKDGNLSMPRLRFASDEGYGIELHGDIAGLARADAKGTLTGMATAEKPEGVASLARLVGLPGDLIPSAQSAGLLFPLRLAGHFDVGTKGPDTSQLSLDGVLADNRLAGTLRIGADQGGWRTRPADLALSLDGPNLPRLVQRFMASGSQLTTAAAGSGPTTPVRLQLRAIGAAKTGLESLVAVTAPGSRAEYHGRLALDDTNQLALNGDVDVAFDDVSRGLAIAGLARRPGFAGSVAGMVHVERKGTTLDLKTDRLAIAGTLAQGDLAFEPSPSGQHVTGTIKLESGSLASAFGALAAKDGASSVSIAAGSTDASPWGETALDLSPLDAIAGSRVRLDIGKLTLADGLAVSKARVELAARAGGIDMRLFEAQALGGAASGQIALDRAPGGVHMTLEARLAKARIEALASRRAADRAQATAKGGFVLAVKGQSSALTPRGLVVALSGAGELSTDHARLEQWSPAAIGIASEAVLGLKGDIPPGALAGQLEAALHAGGVTVGAQKLAVKIADGILSVAPLTVETPRGTITGKAVVDLDHLKFDGEWQIAPRNTPQPPGLPAKPELPGIAIVYAGPVAHLTALEPRFDIEALQREVTVRKVEREVAELERLRHVDEERVRLDAERLAKEKLDAERRLAERLRLESLPQALGSGAISTPAPPPTPPAGNPATPQGGPVPGQAAPQQGTSPLVAPPAASGTSTDTSAQPPVTVQRAPLPRPDNGSSATPAKGKRTDPFRKLMDSNP